MAKASVTKRDHKYNQGADEPVFDRSGKITVKMFEIEKSYDGKPIVITTGHFPGPDYVLHASEARILGSALFQVAASAEIDNLQKANSITGEFSPRGWNKNHYKLSQGLEDFKDRLVYLGCSAPKAFGVGDEDGIVADDSPVHMGFIKTMESLVSDFESLAELADQLEVFDEVEAKRNSLRMIRNVEYSNPEGAINEITKALQNVQATILKDTSELMAVADIYRKNLKDQQQRTAEQ